MENNELFQLKNQNFMKALNREETEFVPNIMSSSGGTIFWSGKTIYDVMHDPVLYAQALTAVLDEIWVDASAMNGFTTTPRIGQTFPGAENRFGPDGALSHLQKPPMKADEYDQLLADPAGFVPNVILPRKLPELFGDRQTAKEALKVFAEEQFYNFVQVANTTNGLMAEKYGITTFVNPSPMLNTPLDHLFDFFRGFRGTLTDLRRQPAKVKAALEAIWELRWEQMTSQPHDFGAIASFQPCHIPAYLSPKQFDELYWPYEKKLVEWVNKSGAKAFIILEGKWDRLLPYFKELPKDSCILHVDDDDFLKAYEVLGQDQILMGGLKAADCRLKTFDRVKDDVKRVIDTCAPGGGFLFSCDKGWLTPGDLNPTVIEAYNFAHEYSKK